MNDFAFVDLVTRVAASRQARRVADMDSFLRPQVTRPSFRGDSANAGRLNGMRTAVGGHSANREILSCFEVLFAQSSATMAADPYHRTGSIGAAAHVAVHSFHHLPMYSSLRTFRPVNHLG